MIIDFFALLKPSIPVERPGKASFRDDTFHKPGWFEEKKRKSGRRNEKDYTKSNKCDDFIGGFREMPLTNPLLSKMDQNFMPFLENFGKITCLRYHCRVSAPLHLHGESWIHLTDRQRSVVCFLPPLTLSLKREKKLTTAAVEFTDTLSVTFHLLFITDSCCK